MTATDQSAVSATSTQRYGLVTYAAESGPRAALLVDDRLLDLDDVLPDRTGASVDAMLQAWDRVAPLLDEIAGTRSGGWRPLAEQRLLAPLPKPLAIYCMGANYQQHLDNMLRAQNLPPQPDTRTRGMPPFFFLKTAHCVVGPDTDVPLSGTKLDWEAELVAVIGRECRDIAPADALDHVAGYTLANDLSARDRAVRANGDPTSPFFFDFVAQKSFDGSCPLGPAIIPARFVPDPQALAIRLWVNDQLRIDSSTAEMIYPLAEQIAHLSTFATLYPGDLVLTGTPAGVGAETDEYLARGDEIRIEIGDLGTLRTRIV